MGSRPGDALASHERNGRCRAPIHRSRSPNSEADPCAKAQRQSWAELLQRTFAVDVLRCPTCGGRRHRVATLTDPLVARRILKHLRLRAEPPPLAPARPEPQLRFA